MPDARQYVVLSHSHKDPSELMPDLLATYPVRHVWNSGAPNPTCSYRALPVNSSTATGLAYHDALEDEPDSYGGEFKSPEVLRQDPGEGRGPTPARRI